MLFGRRISAHQTENPVGVIGVGGPDLLAVDDEIVTVAFGAVLRFDTIFPARLSEIAILVTARHWSSHYEWYAHKRLALKGGMDPKIIEAIRDRRAPSFGDPRAQMIYDVAKSLHEAHGLSPGLYEEAIKVLKLRGLVEIIGLCGYYTMVSMTLNTFQFELPDGETSELA